MGLLAKDERERLERDEQEDEDKNESGGPVGKTLREGVANGKEAKELDMIKKKAK